VRRPKSHVSGTDRTPHQLEGGGEPGCILPCLWPGQAADPGAGVIGMWKAFRALDPHPAPQASIYFDKFHVTRTPRGPAGSSTQSRRASIRALSDRIVRLPQGPEQKVHAPRASGEPLDASSGPEDLARAQADSPPSVPSSRTSRAQLWPAYDREGWRRGFLGHLGGRSPCQPP